MSVAGDAHAERLGVVTPSVCAVMDPARWFIDSVAGSDVGAGNEVQPLRTFAELNRRLNRSPWVCLSGIDIVIVFDGQARLGRAIRRKNGFEQ